MNPTQLLVPVDLSTNSERQIEYLCERLQPSQALITLVHVAEPSIPDEDHYDDVAAESPDFAKERESLQRLANQIQQHLPDVVVQAKLDVGYSVKVLRELVLRQDFDAIVLGSHRHGPVYDFVFGSVAAEVYRAARCPVHVVPSASLSHRGSIIMAAIDIWTEGAVAFIRAAEAHRQSLGADTLQLVYAHAPDPSEAEGIRDDLREKLGTLVAEAFTEGAPSGIEWHVDFGKPFLVLRKHAAREKPLAVVLGAHHHGPMHDLVLGSVSRKLVKEAEWPVVLVPADHPTPTRSARRVPPFTAREQFALMRHFRGMKPAQCKRLFRAAARRKLSKGDVLMRMGEPADSIYLVLSGSLNLQIPIGLKARVMGQKVDAGSLIGLSSFLPEPVSTFTAFAREDCELVVIKSSALIRECGDDAAFGVGVLQSSLTILFERMESLVETAKRHPSTRRDGASNTTATV